jgi:hypothetical protein
MQVRIPYKVIKQTWEVIKQIIAFAQNNINNLVFLASQNKLFEERIEKLEEDLLNFEQKYRAITVFVKKLKDVIRVEIENLDSQDEDIKTFLLEKLQQAYKYDFELEKIAATEKADKEAYNWLLKNRSKLVLTIQNWITQGKLRTKNLDNSVIRADKITQFCKDIDLYLSWIAHYMNKGDAPNSPATSVINFTLPPEAYVEVFQLIRNQIVSTNYGLSEQAVTRIQIYLDRFLIEPLSKLKVHS